MTKNSFWKTISKPISNLPFCLPLKFGIKCKFVPLHTTATHIIGHSLLLSKALFRYNTWLSLMNGYSDPCPKKYSILVPCWQNKWYVVLISIDAALFFKSPKNDFWTFLRWSLCFLLTSIVMRQLNFQRTNYKWKYCESFLLTLVLEYTTHITVCKKHLMQSKQ